jgi:hypothetical protein
LLQLRRGQVFDIPLSTPRIALKAGSRLGAVQKAPSRARLLSDLEADDLANHLRLLLWASSDHRSDDSRSACSGLGWKAIAKKRGV